MYQSSGYGEEVRGADDLKNLPKDDEISSNKKKPKKIKKAQKSKNLKTIKRSNKLVQALNLPTLCNMNPRSLYNKMDEFHKLVKEEELDVM